MQGIETRERQSADLFDAAGFHGVRQNQRAQRAHATGAPRHLGEIGEHLGHHCNGGNAGALTFDGIVDTPRRTRPSGAETDDGRIDRANEAGDLATFLFGRADASARIEDNDVTHTPTSLRLAADGIGEMHERAPRPIDAQTEHAPLEGDQGGRERLQRLRGYRSRVQDVDHRTRHTRLIAKHGEGRKAEVGVPCMETDWNLGGTA